MIFDHKKSNETLMKYRVKLSDYDIDYQLLAVRTRIVDVKFAYLLNKSSFFSFRRLDQDIFAIINKKNVYFSTFEYIDKTLKRKIFLIQNKANHKQLNRDLGDLFSQEVDAPSIIPRSVFLVPELKKFDFFLKLVGVWSPKELQQLKFFLKNMDIVESEITVNLKNLKSIGNLVF